MNRLSEYLQAKTLVETVESSPKIIVGVIGKKGSGKSTITSYLTEQLTGLAVTISFAKPVKGFAIQLGWNGEKNEKGRKILQLLGTDIGRELISETIWINKWEESVRQSNSRVIFIDDVRFDNEADIVKSLGGILIKISGRAETVTTELDNHASELGVSALPDFHLHNSGSVTDLYQQLNVVERYIIDRL